MTKLAGDGQSGTVGQQVDDPPEVRIADNFGNPVAGVPVTFTVSQGTGTIARLGNAAVNDIMRTTSGDGRAALMSWTLGGAAGAQTVTAMAGVAGITGSPAVFTATAMAGSPAILMKESGDNQTAPTGTQVPVRPSVRLTDQFGNLLPGYNITFGVKSGGGTATGTNPLTTAQGIATVGSWTLGPVAGPNTLEASLGTLTVTFNATALAQLNAGQYEGTYSGNWTNTTFASVGTGTVTIDVDEGAMTASVTGSATGNVLGSGGVGPITRNGPYGTSSATFNGVLPTMGTVSGTLNADGTLTLSGTNIPDPSITRWDATGTITPAQIQLSFTVTFNAGPPAVGTITLNRQ
jgi:adhesin/invasin